jgi:RHS repeat-associated protein
LIKTLTSANSTEIRADNSRTAYSQIFGYDVFGNRYYRQTENPNNPVSQSWTETADINLAKNRFAANITYDEQGNVKIDYKFRQRQFEYDANGRQKRSVALDGSSGEERTVYDGLDQRVANTIGQLVRHSVYDAFGKMIAEYENVAPPSQPQTKYLLTDKNGAVRVTTNAQGNVVSRQDYAAFGEEIYAGVGQRTTAHGFNANANIRHGFNSLEQDEAIGLTHTQWRKYDSSSGRWTTPDPYDGSISAANPQSYNRYNYVENDPANMIDTFGLSPYG